jgi:two-component system sensor histidine kinase/response regulator
MPEVEIIDQMTFSKLLDSLGGDVDFMNELVEAYFTSTPDLITSIKQALATGDAPALQRASHSLKTGSASFGALSFADRCKELEDIGKSGVLEGAVEKLAAIEAAYPEVTAALQARLQAARIAPG